MLRISSQRSIQETEATLGLLSRKRFNAGSQMPTESLEELKEQVQGPASEEDTRLLQPGPLPLR